MGSQHDSLTYAYDPLGRQTLRVDPRGQRVSYVFDAVGQQIRRRYPDGTRVTAVYDAVGNRVLAHDSTGRYSRTYDSLNRTTVSKQPSGKRLSFSWDAIGQRRAMVDLSGGRTTYNYDAAGQLLKLVNPQLERTTYTYDQAGQRLTQVLANGTTTTMIVDAAGRTTRVAHLKPNLSRIELLRYSFDAADRRTRRIDLQGDRTTWTYDAAGQLTGEWQTGPTSLKATFLYDAAGNRTSQRRNGDVTQYRYNTANQALAAITLMGRTSYSYDAAGNQTAIKDSSGNIVTTIWDAESRQQAVEEPSGARTTFTYTCDHWRISRDDGFTDVRYQWDKNNLLAETDNLGTVQVQYTNEPEEFGNLISQRQPTETVYYHFDAQGSTVALTDPAAAISDRYQYDAWGNSISTTGTTTNPYLWIGQQGYRYDEALQRHTLRRREYDAQLGRFFSQDPKGLEAGDPNFYRYVSNNPTNIQDPTGLDADAKFVTNGQILEIENSVENRLDGEVGRFAPNDPTKTRVVREVDGKSYCLSFSRLVILVRDEWIFSSEDWDVVFED